MAVPAPFTETHYSPNRSPRQNVARKGVVLHHAAMTSFSGLLRLSMGAKQVSATACCKDGNLAHVVPNDGDRPWSLSSAWGDSAFRSVETANESTDGWTISDASHWTLARAVAYWAQRDGFYPHRNGAKSTWTVIGHREVYEIYDESYGTACPGGMDLNLVTARAQQILAGTSGGATEPVKPKPTKAGNDMLMIHWNEPKAVLKPGKAGVSSAVFGSRNHFMVFSDKLVITEFYADSLTPAEQKKANQYGAQCSSIGQSVLVPKSEYEAIKARVQNTPR